MIFISDNKTFVNDSFSVSANNKRKTILGYVSEDPGTGKTHAAIERAATLADCGELIVITQPTIQLLDATYRKLAQANGFGLKLIHSENCEHAVAEIMAYVSGGYKKEYSEAGHILLITQIALDRIPYFENAKAWHYICDEPPAVDDTFTLQIPETKDVIYHGYLQDMFETTPAHDRYDLLTVSATGRKVIEDMAANKNHDAVWKLLQPLAARIMAQPPWTVYVRSHDGLLSSDDGQPKDRLVAYAVRKPAFFSRFKSATVLGAKLQDTLLFKYYERQGVHWVEDVSISRKLRHRGQANADRVRILYAFNRQWSKRFRDKDGGKWRDAYVAAVKPRLNGSQFVWMGNKDVPDTLFGGATRLANAPHGLNDYIGYDVAVIVSALNPNPHHQHFLTSVIGASGVEIHTAIHKSTIYQAVTRISVRDPENTNEKLIIVPDHDSAQWLQQQFPGSVMEPLGLAEDQAHFGGRPLKGDKAMSSTERSRACRQRQRLLLGPKKAAMSNAEKCRASRSRRQHSIKGTKRLSHGASHCASRNPSFLCSLVSWWRAKTTPKVQRNL
jgi:hypothetical protein